MPSQRSLTVQGYDREIDRLYQCMVLHLSLTGRAGRKSQGSITENRVFRNRRIFLDSLCLLCDRRRGGASVTAMAIEEKDDRYVLWVSQNHSGRKLMQHLTRMLTELQHMGNMVDGEERAEKREAFLGFTAEYSRLRIEDGRKSGRQCLVNAIEVKRGKGEDTVDWENLVEILDITNDPRTLCEQAFIHRTSPGMISLKAHEKTSIADDNPGLAHHYIGRLADQHRAVNTLIEKWPDVSVYFSPVIICRVPAIQPHPRVLAMKMESDNITIKSVLRKHYVAHDVKYQLAIDTLTAQDHKHQYFANYKELYKKYANHKSLTVHCEISMAEHFYHHKLTFAGQDKYISVSKPVCRMCSLYLKLHPLDVEEPKTKNNMWLSWTPPLIKVNEKKMGNDKDQQTEKAQLEERLGMMRKIIGRLCPILREDINKWLMDPVKSSKVTVDSMTAITESVASGDVDSTTRGSWSDSEDQEFDDSYSFEDEDSDHNTEINTYAYSENSHRFCLDEESHDSDFPPILGLGPKSHVKASTSFGSDSESDDGGGCLLFQGRNKGCTR